MRNIIINLFIGTTTLFSLGHTTANAAQDGLYLGLDAAYEEYDNSISVDGFATNLSSFVKPKGAAAGFILGIRQSAGRFNMAIEGRYGYTLANYNLGDATALGFDKYKYEGGNSFSISILPGFHISNDLLIYSRLGYVRSQYKEKFTQGIVETTAGGYQGGLEYGVGLQYDLTGNFSLRAEYTRTDYKNTTESLNINGVIFDTSSNFNRNKFMLGVILGL
ncbi:MAG: hypothetical protein COA93_03915 [Alphaproteobacteria bacterium]|nr:MAG: hypothetical protein COA93_03915 [Alphaproteobacteria bacterium]